MKGKDIEKEHKFWNTQVCFMLLWALQCIDHCWTVLYSSHSLCSSSRRRLASRRTLLLTPRPLLLISDRYWPSKLVCIPLLLFAQHTRRSTHAYHIFTSSHLFTGAFEHACGLWMEDHRHYGPCGGSGGVCAAERQLRRGRWLHFQVLINPLNMSVQPPMLLRYWDLILVCFNNSYFCILFWPSAPLFCHLNVIHAQIRLLDPLLAVGPHSSGVSERMAHRSAFQQDWRTYGWVYEHVYDLFNVAHWVYVLGARWQHSFDKL